MAETPLNTRRASLKCASVRNDREKSESIPAGSCDKPYRSNGFFFFLLIQLFVMEIIKQMSGEKIIDLKKKFWVDSQKSAKLGNVGELSQAGERVHFSPLASFVLFSASRHSDQHGMSREWEAPAKSLLALRNRRHFPAALCR